jgi:glycosyltransferase involved in cell wall biosynthesis
MAERRVSIVMNIRNGAPYLREAIDSALAQTFTDWELIIWDDRSTDDSARIAQSYTDPRIAYYLSPDDTPLGAARRSAIGLARGEFIGFLDQDDVWLPRKLEWQVALADSDPSAALIYGRTVSFDASGAQTDFDHRHEHQLLPEGDIFETLFRDSSFICICSAFLRRSVVAGIPPIPDHIHMSPDYYLYLWIARAHRARAVQDVVCRYRWHGNNMTYRVKAKIHEECLWMIEQWEADIDPALAAWRRRVHHTLVAVDELQRGNFRWRGFLRLVRYGSAPYLFSRPFAIAWRAIHRRLRRPVWQRGDYGASLTA